MIDDSPPWEVGTPKEGMRIEDFFDDKPLPKKPLLELPTETGRIVANAPPMPEKGKWHKNWFSNMLPFDEPLVYERISYLAVENFYQACKIPRDRQDLRMEVAAMTPQKSKTNIKKYPLDPLWNDAKKINVMEFALRHKYFPGTSWHKKLMETGNEEIVEWNNWNDVWWGTDISSGDGLNNLGKLLMKLRKEYQLTKIGNKKNSDTGIYCGRGSLFGNPYTHIKDRETKAEFIVETREESLDKFREYFYKRIVTDKDFKKAVKQLRNETLVCYCVPAEKCHCETITNWLFKNI